jgi:hypothetical protein
MIMSVYLSGNASSGYILWYNPEPSKVMSRAVLVQHYLEWSEARCAEEACKNLLAAIDRVDVSSNPW